MISFKSVAVDKPERRLKGRIDELEKSKRELWARLLEYKHSEKAMSKSEKKFEYTPPKGKEYRFNTQIADNGVTSVLAISCDITDRKEAKTRLKENEKNLAEAQKIAHPENRNWNTMTHESYRSEDIYKIFRYSPQKFGASYDAFLSYMYPKDQDYVDNAVSGTLDGKPYGIDHRIILTSGEEQIVYEEDEVTCAKEKMRNSGIDIVGDIPWGTHFCQFYQTKEDLTDVLVPYFKAGLENNEFCMWVTSQPLDVKDAKEALKRVVPDIDDYLEKGQIEIIPYTHLYVQEDSFDSERILNGWIEKLNQALEDGYEGLRLSGNTFWLEKEDWEDFVDYEEGVDRVIGNYRMIALCTYCLERCNATEIIDVVINHQFALIKKEGKWEQIESSKRKRAEETALQAAKDWKYTFDAVPDLIAIIDTEYRVVRANRAMAAKLGMTPEECVGLTCYRAIHETNEPPSFCPHRQLLQDGTEHITEVFGNCLEGYFLVNALPLQDSEGKIVGSVHVAHDISERKQAEEALIRSENEFRTLAENSPDLIARFDRQNRHLYVNPVSVEIYGHPQEKVIGKTHSELGRDPEQIKFWEEHHERVFATGKPETVEFQYTSPQGEEYYFNTRIVPEFVDGEVASVLAISRDITDIKEATIRLKETLDNLEELVEDRTAQLEKAYRLLKKSEKSLAEAQKIAHLGNWNWNIVTEELYWSDEIYRIFGCAPQEFIATYDIFLSYVHPDDRENVENAIKEALNGKTYSIDYRIVLASGEERIVHGQGKVFFDEDVPVRMMGIVQDITGRKKAEKALESANAYNRSLIEASLDLLVTIGSDGKITDVNKATELITGYNRCELIGTDFSDYFTEPEKAKEGYKQAFREGLVRDYALEIHHRDGSITPVLYNASVYRDEDGEVIGVFAAARDVTELKKAEEKIQTLANVVESSNDAIITESLGGIITSWNKGAEQVYGYMAEEVIGKNMSILEPDNLKREIKQLVDRVKQGKKVQHHETLRVKKDGTIVNISVTLSPVFDVSGKLVAISNIAGDITEKKISENLLHEKQMAEVANRTKNDFLANMSHELRTPLNSVIGFSDMLYEQVYGELNQKQMRAVGNVSSSGKHLLNLINGILDLSKIEANKMELNYREFELATKIDLIRNVLHPLADKKNIDIEIDMDSELTRICADEEKFTRIMYNLVDNAIKFSYENSLVKIGARKKDNLVEITVTDTGIGIKTEDHHKLFKPFSQVNAFYSKKFQGTGLGLSLVKQIVNLHGGYVWFRSEQGEGSTFAFAIPITSKMKVLACYH
ncbi:sensory transduction histidine kinase [Methanosarcina siciliae HI350]|uniref:histidine kinase n=1 Tax=Methanosarcina siciliae HI350 TaxID=1434119 RepID=A0A0E3PG01_9EURY|nr:PAS domain S-box protein [Methanosarcina siciliae]AKB32859.1 sensory transduction histidine kinase [Methanosarcina siciliae HI350]